MAMTLRLSVSAALVLAVAIVAPVLAQQSGGVKIQGNTTLDVNAKDVNTIATGTGNTAITNIGTINQDTMGSSHTTVDVKNVENVVGGHNHKGCVSIGAKGTCD
jgi:azurin